MFEFFRALLQTEDSKAMFILMLICVAMIIDFLTGTIAAKINPDIEFISKAGINGILRKIASVILLTFFIPVSVVIPNGVGTGLLYVLYFGYLMMEMKSILENYKKMGNDSSLFDDFLAAFNKDKGDGKNE